MKADRITQEVEINRKRLEFQQLEVILVFNIVPRVK